MAQAAAKTCEICLSAPGRNYCCDCEQNFCEKCTVQHKRTKLGKDHHFQGAFDVIKDIKPKCETHNEDFSFLCLKCDIPVCGSCVADQHNGHRMSKLKNSIEKMIMECEQICSKVVQTSKSESNLSGIISKFDQDVEVAIKAVTKEGKRAKALIDKHVNDMITDIKRKASKEQEMLTGLSKEIQAIKASAENLGKRLDQLKLTRQDGALLKNLKTLRDEIINLKTAEPTESPIISFTPGNLKMDNLKILLGDITFCGHAERKRKTSKPRFSRTGPGDIKGIGREMGAVIVAQARIGLLDRQFEDKSRRLQTPKIRQGDIHKGAERRQSDRPSVVRRPTLQKSSSL